VYICVFFFSSDKNDCTRSLVDDHMRSIKHFLSLKL
jgi:hypothetical protein